MMTAEVIKSDAILGGDSESSQLASYLPGETVRKHFPVFEANVRNERPLAFLDSAASSQKPEEVIATLERYYRSQHANIHRGAYELSTSATAAYEAARGSVETLLGAPKDSLVFTRGTTEGINLVARSLENYFSKGDTIVLSVLEHHSNIVPWQLLAERTGVTLHFADCDEHGWLSVDSVVEAVREHKPKLVALTALANGIGACIDVRTICAEVRKSGGLMLIDGAQSVPHLLVNVIDLDCDFFVFSGHKAYGPTGIGGLYIRPETMELLEPFHGGGDMIETVTLEGSTWASGIQKFEAGTPAIAEGIGMGVAAEFLKKVGMERAAKHEEELFHYAWEAMARVPGISLYGPANEGNPQRSVITFNLNGAHPHDVAAIADTYNVQLRAGHHCCMPLLNRLGLDATVRASFGIYTTTSDIDQLIEALTFASTVLS